MATSSSNVFFPAYAYQPIHTYAMYVPKRDAGPSEPAFLESKYLESSERMLNGSYARFARAPRSSGGASFLGGAGAPPGGPGDGGGDDGVGNVSYWGAGITAEQLACMVLAHCHEEGIEVPIYFALDFHEHFGGMKPITSLDFGKLGLSLRIDRLMASNRSLRKRYYYFKKRVSGPVLLRMAMRLGFEDLVSRRQGQAPSLRDFLRHFLIELDEGQAWNPFSILEWEHEGQKGNYFHDMISRTVGWSEGAVRAVLGEDADELLRRNPFVKRPNMTVSEGVDRRPSEKRSPKKAVGKRSGTRRRARRTAGKRKVLGGAYRSAWPMPWIYDGDAQIAMNQLVGMVMVYCAEEGIEVPSNFASDFQRYFGDERPIKSFQFGESYICQRINGLLAENGDLRQRYDEFRRQVSYPVRLRMAMQLGFERYVTRRRGKALSYRVLLRRYLSGLDEGQSWNANSLLRWKYRGYSGRSLQRMLYRTVGWSEEAVKVVLGPDADDLLRRNPFVESITDTRKAAGRLIEFLGSLEVGEPWNRTMLEKWTSRGDSIRGDTLIRWIVEKKGGGLREEHVRTLLDDKADHYLTRNPFRPRRANWKKAGG